MLMFYKEEKFKETQIGRIPEDWEVKQIRDLFTVETGTTPSTKKPEYWNGEINWFTPTDLSKLGSEITIEESVRKITQKALKEYSLTLMPKRSILISTRAPVGYVAVLEKEGTFNQGCKGLIPKNLEQIDPLFYAYYLLTKKRTLESLSGGSTFKELSKAMLESFSIPHPPPQEQKKIAEILSTVDKAIQKTDEIIAKTERLKKGLMQELLTGRVRVKVENGRVRFYREENLRFNEELGFEIPEDWEIVRLRDIGEFQYGVTTSATDEDTGIKLLRITDITENGMINWETVPYCKISVNEFKKYALKVRDLLFARIGATTGKTCYIDREVKSVFGSYLIRFSPTKEDVSTNFLYYYTQSAIYWNQVFRVREGQLKKGLNIKTLGNLLTPLPPLPEQQRIAEILSTVDKKLEIERKEKEKLERIKKGLMDVLLTGKVRVKVDERERN